MINMNKSKIYLVAAIVIVLIGSVLFVSGNKKSETNKNNPDEMEVEKVSENSTYGHVHSIFRTADGMLLMGTHNGLFHSMDNGKTFNKMTVSGVMSQDFMNFAYDPNTKALFAGGHDLGVVKSMDNGATWTKADSGLKGTDIHAIAINPLDTNRMFAYSVENGVFGSKDGAKSWYRIDDGPSNPSTRSFGYMATASFMDKSMGTDKTTNIGYLWAGTSGGLYSSFACFCGWTKTSGISDNATVYTLAPDPVNRGTMFAGTKDGIYKTTDEGKNFSKINADIKNVAAITFDPANSKLLFAVTDSGVVYKSEDGGNSWQKISSEN